ncbi:MAG: hypothetical protein COA78_06970 [Blastopirellula sp.]|nr:MAG: hypothetical protein COA78_06970 [Blastopirellula sp.]
MNRDFDEINRKFSDFVRKAKGLKTERAMTQMLIQAGAYSAELTPIATSFLLNSQYREVRLTMEGWRGEIGYGANYAASVHGASGKNKGKSVSRTPARLGFVWGPSAEPQFLDKGVMLMIKTDADSILRGAYG